MLTLNWSMPLMKEAKKILNKENIDVLWAPQEKFLIFFKLKNVSWYYHSNIDMLVKSKTLENHLMNLVRNCKYVYNDAKLSGYNL